MLAPQLEEDTTIASCYCTVPKHVSGKFTLVVEGTLFDGKRVSAASDEITIEKDFPFDRILAIVQERHTISVAIPPARQHLWSIPLFVLAFLAKQGNPAV